MVDTSTIIAVSGNAEEIVSSSGSTALNAATVASTSFDIEDGSGEGGGGGGSTTRYYAFPATTKYLPESYINDYGLSGTVDLYTLITENAGFNEVNSAFSYRDTPLQMISSTWWSTKCPWIATVNTANSDTSALSLPYGDSSFLSYRWALRGTAPLFKESPLFTAENSSTADDRIICIYRNTAEGKLRIIDNNTSVSGASGWLLYSNAAAKTITVKDNISGLCPTRLLLELQAGGGGGSCGAGSSLQSLSTLGSGGGSGAYAAIILDFSSSSQTATDDEQYYGYLIMLGHAGAGVKDTDGRTDSTMYYGYDAGDIVVDKVLVTETGASSYGGISYDYSYNAEIITDAFLTVGGGKGGRTSTSYVGTGGSGGSCNWSDDCTDYCWRTIGAFANAPYTTLYSLNGRDGGAATNGSGISGNAGSSWSVDFNFSNIPSKTLSFTSISGGEAGQNLPTADYKYYSGGGGASVLGNGGDGFSSEAADGTIAWLPAGNGEIGAGGGGGWAGSGNSSGDDDGGGDGGSSYMALYY